MLISFLLCLFAIKLYSRNDIFEHNSISFHDSMLHSTKQQSTTITKSSTDFFVGDSLEKNIC